MVQKRKQSFQPGDHVCSIYSTTNQLITVTAAFLAEGLTRGERCWYVARGRERYPIADALRKRHVDVDACLRSGALRFAAGHDAYLLHGRFNPERTLDVFNDAIDQASHDGWTGFRAAAEMSWALGVPDRTERVIAYEALLKSLFRSARATGLCLYPRRRMCSLAYQPTAMRFRGLSVLTNTPPPTSQRAPGGAQMNSIMRRTGDWSCTR